MKTYSSKWHYTGELDYALKKVATIIMLSISGVLVLYSIQNLVRPEHLVKESPEKFDYVRNKNLNLITNCYGRFKVLADEGTMRCRLLNQLEVEKEFIKKIKTQSK